MVTGLGTLMGCRTSRLLKEVRLARKLAMAAYRVLLRGPTSRCLTHNEEDKEYLSSTFEVSSTRFFVTPGCGVDPKVFPYFEKLSNNSPKIISCARTSN